MATIDPIKGPPPEFDVHRVPAVDRHRPRRRRGEDPRERERPENDAFEDEAEADDPFAVDVFEPSSRRDEPDSGA